MTHKPPVPSASQSPYPLHPQPVPRQAVARPARERTPPVRRVRRGASTGWTIGLGAAAALGVAFLFARRR